MGHVQRDVAQLTAGGDLQRVEGRGLVGHQRAAAGARPQGTLVVGVHAGFVDTDMTAAIDAPKLAPVEVAAMALDAVETGAFEVLADDISRHVRSSLGDELAAMYPELAA